MSIILFLVILAILILVHEFGHFVVAKRNGIAVEEFGLGFPPRAKKLFTKDGTDYTLNWIPFGGFVRLFGEDGNVKNLPQKDVKKSFAGKSRWVQAKVLLAGVVFNALFAWLLLSIVFMSGITTVVDGGSKLLGHVGGDVSLAVSDVLPGSPADRAGLMPGDVISGVSRDGEHYTQVSSVAFENLIQTSEYTPVFISFIRDGRENSIQVIPLFDMVVPDEIAIGVSLGVKGELKLPVHKAIWHGGKATIRIVVETVKSIGQLIGGKVNLSLVSGPVGIAGLVGDAAKDGMIQLLLLTSIISANLAVINLIPFPALDGGRLLFVIIEGITRKKIPAKVGTIMNTIGFFLLIALMILITYHDIIKLF
jgi:regulator of sigma E protease